MNSFKTALLLIALTGLLIFCGALLDGLLHTSQFIYIFFIISLGMNFFSYWYSDKLVLKMHHAREVSPTEMPELHDIVGRLSRQAGIPMPKVYVVPMPVPNAFATGRNPSHAAVAVTEGILRILDRNQLEGVLAHELAHIRNRDTLISTMAAMIAGAVMMMTHVARWGLIFSGGSRDRDNGGGLLGALLLIILAPIAAMLIQMAISRTREYRADAVGSEISHQPLALANALMTLEQFATSHKVSGAVNMENLYIVNPFRGKGVTSLFSTHPSTSDRVERLREIAARMGIFS